MILGPVNQTQTDVPPEDSSPSTDKVYQDHDGHWVITDVQGLKLGIRWRLDGQGYDVVKSESSTLFSRNMFYKFHGLLG